MSIKSFAAATAIALCTFTTQALAAATWTITATGTITTGTDTSGLFVAPGGNLSGQAFSQTITISSDPADWPGKQTTSSTNYLYAGFNDAGSLHGPGLTTTVTVNGHTLTYSLPYTEYAEQLVSNSVTQYGPIPAGIDQYPDFIYMSGYAHLAGGGALSAQSYALNRTEAFVPALGFGQALSLDTSAASFQAYSAFSISGDQNAYFQGRIATFEVNPPSAVPEPETCAVLLTGLGLIGFAARRGKRQV